MDKNKLQTFILDVNNFDQKICTLESKPSKKYLLDDDGKLIEYDPEISICAIKLETEGSRTEEESNSTFSDSNEIVQLDDPTQLGLMTSFDSVSEFEQNLMNELDSDYMNMVPNPHSQYIMQHMDIREPLRKLRKLIENRLGVSLKNYSFSLQGVQIVDDNKNLVEQCVQGEGIVQINVHVQTNLGRINIIDVLKPAEDYVHMDDVELDKPSDKVEEDTQNTKPGNSKSMVQWQEDPQYKKQQEKLKIPSDPEQWTAVHVRHWVQWAVRRFDIANIKLHDWNMTGKELQEMSREDFKNIVPNDPGRVFWTHFELLRKMKVVATIKNDASKDAIRNVVRPKSTPKKEMKVMNYTTAMNCLDMATVSASGNRSGNNGQIQLWQFLLELLTTQEYKSIIQWIGKDGEFKLNHPEVVAHLWGERKNKPTMNYEKLSRALRYYYDGDMISKVQGKRFVYKFVCDLKQLVGYSAIELANLVKYGNPMGEE